MFIKPALNSSVNCQINHIDQQCCKPPYAVLGWVYSALHPVSWTLFIILFNLLHKTLTDL